MYSSIQKKSPLVQKWPSFVLFSLLLEKNRERLYDCSRCVVVYFHQKFYHKVRSIVMSKHTELDCRPLHLLFHNELKYTYSQKIHFGKKLIFLKSFWVKVKYPGYTLLGWLHNYHKAFIFYLDILKWNIFSLKNVNFSKQCLVLPKWTFSHVLVHSVFICWLCFQTVGICR